VCVTLFSRSVSVTLDGTGDAKVAKTKANKAKSMRVTRVVIIAGGKIQYRDRVKDLSMRGKKVALKGYQDVDVVVVAAEGGR
jgi:hypothetical protein